MAENINALIEFFGNQSLAGKALGVSQATVSYWLSGAQKVSPEKALLAEVATKGLIKASSLSALIAEVEARHKVGESSTEYSVDASGLDGSVCTSSMR